MTQLRSDVEPGADLPVVPFYSFVLILMAAAAGAGAAIFLLPAWLPGLSASMGGSAPKVFWFLSRSSAGVAYILLWLSMLSGQIITNKLARLWPGGPAAFDLHQYFSLLGLAFALFHALILIGDHYIRFDLGRVFVPFSNPDYRPAWVGLGQISFYLMAIISLTFYVRRQIGQRLWRLIHYLSFAMYVLALAHGVFSGTDTPQEWVRLFYWASGGLALFLLVFRLLMSWLKPSARQASVAK